MKINNAIFLSVLMLGVFAPNISTDVSSTVKALQPSSSSVIGALQSYHLDNTECSVPHCTDGKRVHKLATSGSKIFASMLNVPPYFPADPAKLYAWNTDCPDFTTFCPSATGPISKIVASPGFVATLNTRCPAIVDVWSDCGNYLAQITTKAPVVDMATMAYEDSLDYLYLAHGKHFDLYYTNGDYIDTYPVVAGQVQAVSTYQCSEFIFTINNNTNNIECWDDRAGVLISSIQASGVVNPNLFIAQDGYVFAVLTGSCETQDFIYVYDFTTPTSPVLHCTITAEGMIQQMVVSSYQGVRVFATNSEHTRHVQGWLINDDCDGYDIISGFNPLCFDVPVAQIAAAETRITVYGDTSCEDHMMSYQVCDGTCAAWFYLPHADITLLASTDNAAFAVFANAPDKVQRFCPEGGHAVEFCQSTCGCITQLVAGVDAIVTISGNGHKADLFDADGEYYTTIDFGCETVTDVAIGQDALYFAVGNFVRQWAGEGFNSNFIGNAYAPITKLSTTVDAPVVFAVTENDSIIAFDVCMGNHAGQYNATGDIKLMQSLSNGYVLFVYEACPDVIQMVDFSTVCTPTLFNTLDTGSSICKMVAENQYQYRVFVVHDDSDQVYGWEFLQEGCCNEWVNQALCMFNPLTATGNIKFLVGGCSQLFIAGCDFLQSYSYENGDLLVTFNLHDQITHLASTHWDRVFATMISDKNRIYAWESCGGNSTTFCQTAAGPAQLLTATTGFFDTYRDFIATLSECGRFVDIWRYDGCYLGQIKSCGINDVTLNNVVECDSCCDCDGSVYLARAQHFDHYNTCGQLQAVLPQVSGQISHIAASDNGYVYTTNTCNNNIEAYNQVGVFQSNIAASGSPLLLVAKNNFVYEVNAANTGQIELFDFTAPTEPVLFDTITVYGNMISQLAASTDGSKVYATNTVISNIIQGWNVTDSCSPTNPICAYNPFELSTPLINYLAVDCAVVAVFGEAPLYPEYREQCVP